MSDGAEGFYVTMKRGARTAYLLGPYPDKATAECHVTAGSDLACQVDPFAGFDAFGVTRVVMKPGASLPAGKLNAMHAATV
jgi:hypothetical protein